MVNGPGFRSRTETVVEMVGGCAGTNPIADFIKVTRLIRPLVY